MAHSTPLTDEDPMPFGIHRGKPLKDVPDEHLLWMWDHIKNGPVWKYIDENIEAIRLNIKNKGLKQQQQS